MYPSLHFLCWRGAGRTTRDDSPATSVEEEVVLRFWRVLATHKTAEARDEFWRHLLDWVDNLGSRLGGEWGEVAVDMFIDRALRFVELQPEVRLLRSNWFYSRLEARRKVSSKARALGSLDLSLVLASESTDPHARLLAKLTGEGLLDRISLTARDRSVITMRYVNADSFDDISEALELSSSSVRSICSKVVSAFGTIGWS